MWLLSAADRVPAWATLTSESGSCKQIPAIGVATSNNRNAGGQAFDTQVQIAKPLAYCGGILSNVIEFVTTDVDTPGAATKRAFVFAVM